MERYGVNIEEGREEFFEYARDVLDFQRGSGESFYNYIPVNSSVFHKHKTESYNVMSFDFFESLFNIVYHSRPRYQLSDIEKYLEPVDMSEDHMNKESVVEFLEDNENIRVKDKDDNRHLFSFIFGHFELEELSNRFDLNESLFKNWRTGKTKTVDYTVLKETADLVNNFYDKKPDLKLNIVDKKMHKGNILEESVVLEDIPPVVAENMAHKNSYRSKTVEKLESLGGRESRAYKTVSNNILEVFNQGNSYIKVTDFDEMDHRDVGIGLSILDDINLLEHWGGKSSSTYRINIHKKRKKEI